jgi:hypothetical protein
MLHHALQGALGGGRFRSDKGDVIEFHQVLRALTSRGASYMEGSDVQNPF